MFDCKDWVLNESNIRFVLSEMAKKNTASISLRLAPVATRKLVFHVRCVSEALASGSYGLEMESKTRPAFD